MVDGLGDGALNRTGCLEELGEKPCVAKGPYVSEGFTCESCVFTAMDFLKVLNSPVLGFSEGFSLEFRVSNLLGFVSESWVLKFTPCFS